MVSVAVTAIPILDDPLSNSVVEPLDQLGVNDFQILETVSPWDKALIQA
jgi:hypothetical protein